MKSLQDYISPDKTANIFKNIKKKPRDHLLEDILNLINRERERRKEEWIQKFMWNGQVSRKQAEEELKKLNKGNKLYFDPMTIRALHFKTMLIPDDGLHYLLQRYGDCADFSRLFFGSIKPRKEETK